MVIQFIISFFSLVVLIGVVRRFVRGTLSRSGVIVWVGLWVAVGALVWIPQVINYIANILGVGRGADAILYISIVVLFYLLFRLHGRFENLEHQLSELVTKIALKDLKK